MAEKMKLAKKKSMHPPFSRMICEAMHELDKVDVAKHGHSMQSLKGYMVTHYKLPAGWEKRLNNAVKVMLHKKQLAHAAGHMGSFRLSKSMAEKEEKRLKRMAKAPKAQAVKKAAAPKKRKAAKMEGPAKRAKKAAPKKAAAKKA